MSGNRKDLHKAKLRRERIRRQKHLDSAPPAPPPPIFASERATREIQALLEGQDFGSIDEANAHLEKLTSGGRLSEMAAAWKKDDPKWRAQELAYDALETDDPIEAMRLVNEAVKLDPRCTDAQRLMVAVLPIELEDRIRLLWEVVGKAEEDLGEAFFKENMGHFWNMVTTRPYMRAKQHLGELLAKDGQIDEAIGIFEYMLELNPSDNQGMRYTLPGLYLSAGRLEDLKRFLEAHEDEKRAAVFAWARVLERYAAGKTEEAGAELAQARLLNPYVERYLSGKTRLPEQIPDYYTPGQDSEARICANELNAAVAKFPDFRTWLRAQ